RPTAEAEATRDVAAGPGVEPGVEVLAGVPPEPTEPVADPAVGARTTPIEPAEPAGPEPAAEAGAAEPLDPARLRGAIEAILLVLDEPASEAVLAQAVGQPTDRVAEALAALAAE